MSTTRVADPFKNWSNWQENLNGVNNENLQLRTDVAKVIPVFLFQISECLCNLNLDMCYEVQLYEA